jgi:hypothetical protein
MENQYYYLDCSMFGSYYVPCEINKVFEDKINITFYDDILEETLTADVDKDRVRSWGELEKQNV